MKLFAEEEYLKCKKRSRWLPYGDTVFNEALNPMVLPTVYSHETISRGSRDG